MIIREFYMKRSDGVNLYKTYSDSDLLIKKIGTDEVYKDAIDVEDAPFKYEEVPEEPKELKREEVINEYITKLKDLGVEISILNNENE